MCDNMADKPNSLQPKRNKGIDRHNSIHVTKGTVWTYPTKSPIMMSTADRMSADGQVKRELLFLCEEITLENSFALK